MAEFLRLILDAIQFIWPFRRVMEWERGVWYVFGRYWRTVRPGIYPVIPWFMEITGVAVVRDNYCTPTQTITTRDGGTLTFKATAALEVIDAAAAQNLAMDHEGTAMEDIAAILADTLADLDVGRLDPDRRRGLLRTCLLEVNKTLSEYGMRAKYIRFNDFVRNMRVYRLMGTVPS